MAYQEFYPDNNLGNACLLAPQSLSLTIVLNVITTCRTCKYVLTILIFERVVWLPWSDTALVHLFGASKD